MALQVDFRDFPVTDTAGSGPTAPFQATAETSSYADVTSGRTHLRKSKMVHKR